MFYIYERTYNDRLNEYKNIFIDVKETREDALRKIRDCYNTDNHMYNHLYNYYFMREH